MKVTKIPEHCIRTSKSDITAYICPPRPKAYGIKNKCQFSSSLVCLLQNPFPSFSKKELFRDSSLDFPTHYFFFLREDNQPIIEMDS